VWHVARADLEAEKSALLLVGVATAQDTSRADNNVIVNEFIFEIF